MIVQCPGCGVKLLGEKLILHDRYHASEECWQLYGALSIHYMTVDDLTFKHQISVDAYGAQHTGEMTRTITTAFALIGLYLAIEKGFQGRQVQQAHMKLARRRQEWPRFTVPEHPYEWTVQDVLLAEPGAKRDEMHRTWAAAVWHNWEHVHDWVKQICKEQL